MSGAPGPVPAGPTGVLVMAHGTPARPEDIGAFYTRIRRGRPPTPEQLDELTGRYAAIGGVSPLESRTRAQVDGVAAELDRRAPGRFVVRYGAKYTEPGIEAAVADLVASGVGAVVGLVLTPHRSSMGSGEYFRRAGEALAEAGRPGAMVSVPQWYDEPAFVDLMADRLLQTLQQMEAATRDATTVLFTAHSLPQRVVAEGDPYPDQVADSASLVAETAEIVDWRVAWQSAGRTPDPWIGPDVLDVIRLLASEGAAGVAVCPIGFVSDHLEVLYDLDVEARGVADRAGVAFVRTPSLNDDPRFLRILADVVEAAAGSGTAPQG